MATESCQHNTTTRHRIVVKKIVVGDSLEHLAKRMGTTLLKMGIARDSVQAENVCNTTQPFSHITHTHNPCSS